MKLKDWLGQEYGVGNLVIYAAMSGRSVTMILGRVTDIYRIYRAQPREYYWVRLAEGEEPPFMQTWDKEAHDYVDTGKRVETEIRVQVQPLGSSRWKHHDTSRTRYVDSRTGKGIDPFRGSRNRHIIEGYWTHDETKVRVTDSEAYNDPRFDCWTRYPYNRPEGWTHTNSEFKPYVKKITEDWAKPVTLIIIENIVKWNGATEDD